ncbi:MAG: hypothetical protein ACKE5M_03415 [Methylophilaceae bacterium]
MMKRFSHVVAYLLLVMMPLQALAAANLMVCNSLMQASEVTQTANVMSCHQMNIAEKDYASETQHQLCKARCAAMCASMAALTVSIETHFLENLPTAIDTDHHSYTSIAQQRFQRPPISFI